MAMISILFGVHALSGLYVRTTADGGEQTLFLMEAAVNALPPFLLGGLLILFAQPLSRWLSVRTPGNEPEPRLEQAETSEPRLRLPSSEGLLNTGLIIVGLVAITEAIYYLVHGMVMFGAITLEPLPEWSETLGTTAKANMTASWLTGGFGLVLVCFSDRLTSWVLPERVLDREPASKPDDEDSGT